MATGASARPPPPPPLSPLPYRGGGGREAAAQPVAARRRSCCPAAPSLSPSSVQSRRCLLPPGHLRCSRRNPSSIQLGKNTRSTAQKRLYVGGDDVEQIEFTEKDSQEKTATKSLHNTSVNITDKSIVPAKTLAAEKKRSRAGRTLPQESG